LGRSITTIRGFKKPSRPAEAPAPTSANAFEALAVYAPAVLVAHLNAPNSTLAPTLALVWVALRVAHGFAYLANLPALRTACFALATLCSIALYLVGGHVL
jgi:uncharacterized MAPEG superfamily protein